MNLKKLERYLRVNLLGTGPRLIKKKEFTGPRFTKFEKHCSTSSMQTQQQKRTKKRKVDIHK